MMDNSLLAVDDLSVEFRSRRTVNKAVRSVSLRVGHGETVAIVGESGSGKSVTALSIMRLIGEEGGRITNGKINFARRDGTRTDLTACPEAEMRRIRGKEIAMIFQEPMTSLNPTRTIGSQLAEVLTLHEGKGTREALVASRQMLDYVRIPDAGRRMKQYPHELSGGMRQRVMIAMALQCKPQLLLADEPTTALDVTIQAQVLSLIDELKRDTGMAVLFITHDLGIVADIAERVVVMRHGELVEQADVRALFIAPQHVYTRTLVAAVPRLGEGHGPTDTISGQPVLSVEGLVKRFPVKSDPFRRRSETVHAVENVSFALGAGETLGLVGESGCGKSTVGRSLMKLVEPTSGRISVAGRDISALSPREMRPMRRDIQMIFQDPYASLNPRMTTVDLVTEPLVIHEPGVGETERWDRAEALLRRVGLGAEHLERFPHQFSGGQRQRICIARALSLSPKVIVADEPVSALDASVQAQVIDLLRELQSDLGIAYLFISHDMRAVERMSHRLAVMYLGQIVEIGPANAILRNPLHPYTRRLLAAVPTRDPARQRASATLDTTEIPSPIRQNGDAPATPPLVEVEPGHFVQAHV
jgi:glutathione transport system ATP-binding protein